MIIDCTSCERRARGECDDCFVMALLDSDRSQAPEMDEEEQKAIVQLRQAGLRPVVLARKKKAG